MAKLNDTEIGKRRWDESKRTRTEKVPGYQSVNDPEVGGLHLRIFPPKATTGQSAKVFYWGYGASTNRKFYKIGQFGEWSLEAARSEARRLRRNFYDHGVDPNKSKQKRIRDAKDRLTVEDLVEAYQAAKEGVWAASYTASNKLHGTRLNDAVGSLFADELTKSDVLGVFDRIKADSPSQAKLFQKFGRGCYNWALDLGPLEKFAGMPNPFVSSKFNIEPTQRQRCLRYKLGECGQLFDLLADFDSQLRSKDNDKSYLIIAKLFLLTGLRNKELREARWEHVDHKLRTLRIVEPKYGAGRAYTMPLTDMGYRLLQSLGEGHIRFRKGPIFPGPIKGDDGVPEPISGFKHWTNTLRHDPRMPLDEDGQWVNLHDLRRTSITWLQQMRFTVEERSIFKGAKPSGVTEAVYSQADQEDIRLRCARDIEARIKDVEAGEEATMFDTWKAPKAETGSA